MASDRELALEEAASHLAQVEKWTAEVVAAEAELADLQARAGEEVLADEHAADRLSGDMARLRERVDIARRAAEAARPRAEQARRQALRAEAVEWDTEAGKRREALEAHERRTRGLLEQLAEHDGCEYAPKPRQVHVAGVLTDVVPGTKAVPLRREVAAAERTAAVLRAVAEGKDPAQVVKGVQREDYPASVWGPDAVLPAPGYVRTVENRQRSEWAQAEQRVASADAEVKRLTGESRCFTSEADREKTRAKLEEARERAVQAREALDDVKAPAGAC